MFPQIPNIVPPSIPDVLGLHKGKHVKGKVVLMRKNVLDFNNFAASAIENVSEFLGQGISLQLVSSTKVDPGNKLGKIGTPAYLENWVLTPPNLIAGGQNEFAVNFELDEEMGTPGAFVIKNNHPTEFFLVSLTLQDVPNVGDIHFVCNSWIYPSSKTQADRIFFSNKTYLPHDTPEPLRKYREQELVNLRGNGRGERQEWERIYDYAAYNDLGQPDLLADLARPVLGGSAEYPYPRRGRTGRPPSKADPNCESRLIQLVQDLDIYVPRDERFGHLKMADFLTYMLKSVSQSLVPVLGAAFKGLSNEFDSFDEAYGLYEGGFELPADVMKNISSQIPLPMLKEIFRTDGEQFLKFPTPHVMKDNKSGWMTDEEFGREILAGVNPILIRLLEEFPPQSRLDSDVYGDQSSKITAEDLEINLDGLSVYEALNVNRLFILDHHDAFMPYLRRINEGPYKGYATRTILFLNNARILKPIAIELSLPHPHADEYGAVSEVYLPAKDGVNRSLWCLAKAYAIVNDSCVHQLGSHWMNTHAVIEPFIIATNRQLSVLHPVHKLLLPHYRDTMNINALARQSLINAGGIIEMCFLPGKYSVEMSSVLYKDWVFTDQALPKDLIKRGMAIEDSSCPHGLRLVIEDYPYANDGLEIWSAIEIWVEEYCSFYYKNDNMVKEDPELQSWWKEILEVGHADKKNEPWWPKMQSLQDLIETCTIIIWTASALHAAVNFGQYPYGGLILNRPTISRRYMPEKGTPAYDELLKNPEKAFLKTITPKLQTLIDLSTIEILSRHTSDEYYLGSRENPNWTSDEKTLEAFRRFGERLAKIEEKLSKRNSDENLQNRTGPVNLPYTVLHVKSETGLTFRGIPNSISI